MTIKDVEALALEYNVKCFSVYIEEGMMPHTTISVAGSAKGMLNFMSAVLNGIPLQVQVTFITHIVDSNI